MVDKPESIKAATSFARVSSLQNTNDLVIFARACCIGNAAVTEKLALSKFPLLSQIHGFVVQSARLRGYVESADVLQARIRNAIDLVSVSLTDQCIMLTDGRADTH